MMSLGMLAYTIAGLLVGTSIGLTGIGGGSMMAPLLILVFHIPAAKAVQLDFLYLTPTKLAGAWQHHRDKTVDPILTLVLAIGAIPGTIIGSVWVARVVASNPDLNLFLRHLIGIFILASAALILIQLAFMWRRQRPYSQPVRVKLSTLQKVLIASVGLAVGLFVGATSIGAGSILLPLLVLMLRVRMRELVSTDVVLGAGMAVAGAIVHSLGQDVPWTLVGALLLGSLPGALLGSKLIGIISTRLVRGFVAGALVIAGLVLTGVLATS
jgi:uncharacterized membrane protein YfcA